MFCLNYSEAVHGNIRNAEHFLAFLKRFCDCTGWFVPDLFVISNCWFSHAGAH